MTDEKKFTVFNYTEYECIPSAIGNQLNAWGTDVSDGHHTMNELYEHRYRLYLALVKIYDNYVTPVECHVRCWKSFKHADGSTYEGYFMLGMTVTLPRATFDPDEVVKTYEISYHIPTKYWHLARVIMLDKAPPFDGYTSNDVLERLLRL